MKYYIRIVGPSFFHPSVGNLFAGGNTLTNARKEAKSIVRHAPDAYVDIVKATESTKSRRPHEANLILVEQFHGPQTKASERRYQQWAESN